MTLQVDRRSTPTQQDTFMVAAIAALCSALAIAVAAAFARAVANGLAGGPWTVTTAGIGRVLFHADAAAGLGGGGPWAGRGALQGWLVVFELPTLVVCVVGVWWAQRRWGGLRVLSAATPAEAERALGRSRLVKARHVIRPDLYPKVSAVDALRRLTGGGRA